MADKPTYEELEQQVNELEKRAHEQKRVADELTKSKTRLEHLLASSPAVTYTCEPAGVYAATFVSENIKDQLGHEPNEFVEDPKFWVNHIHPQDRRRVLNDLPLLFEYGHQVHEYRFKHKEGKYRWMRDEFRLVGDAKGNPKEIVGYWIDITERKRVEERLGDSESKWRQLFKTVSDAIMVFDAETKQFLNVNDAALRLYGYSKQEFLGMKHPDITAEPRKSNASIKQALAGKLDRIPVRYHKKKDGTKFPVEISASYITLKDRKLLCGVIRDITDRMRMEEELKIKQDAVKAKAKELGEANKALRVLMKQRNEEKREFEEKILSNVKELIAPYVDKLKKSGLDTKPMTYLRILESNLNDIVSPFVHQLSSKYSALTPKEIQVAQLIREGNNTREIAELLSSSKRTIECHRQSIRNKFGIKDTKANLRSYLFSV
ncbi:MAG: PAS domain S-box protein [Desulfobacterales bacterium]|nr:MAG: PAS domain S-box protein [Desulfobacterales bacterium]